MIHPQFSMSQYMSTKDLYKAKAEYYEKQYNALADAIRGIIHGHRLSAVDWDSMKTSESLLDKHIIEREIKESME